MNEFFKRGLTHKTSKRESLNELLKVFQEENAVLLAHYYTSPELKSLAEQSGGIVADSLEMAKFGSQVDANTIVIAGVRFMGETAKILTPHKRVLMASIEATCSLDLGCPIDGFSEFCDEYSDHKVVVYANTSAAVKARSDWVVTSSNAVDVVEYLNSLGEKILWAPDKNLGCYIQNITGAEMKLWNGSCVVHDEFKANAILELKHLYENACVIAHPESPYDVLQVSEFVGSTSKLIKYVEQSENNLFVVATDKGIFSTLQNYFPEKQFLLAPTAGEGATCRTCARCPWMALNEIERLKDVLKLGKNEIILSESIIKGAKGALENMLSFDKIKYELDLVIK